MNFLKVIIGLIIAAALFYGLDTYFEWGFIDSWFGGNSVWDLDGVYEKKGHKKEFYIFEGKKVSYTTDGGKNFRTGIYDSKDLNGDPVLKVQFSKQTNPNTKKVEASWFLELRLAYGIKTVDGEKVDDKTKIKLNDIDFIQVTASDTIDNYKEKLKTFEDAKNASK